MKKGALVMLRSGGPEMVIERIDTEYRSADRYARCQWFDKLRLRTERFAVHVLELSCPAPDAPPPAPGEDDVADAAIDARIEAEAEAEVGVEAAFAYDPASDHDAREGTLPADEAELTTPAAPKVNIAQALLAARRRRAEMATSHPDGRDGPDQDGEAPRDAAEPAEAPSSA